MITYVNHAFLQEENATLRIGDLAIQRGYAAFEYFRIKNYSPLFLEDYLDRFFCSADLMYLHPKQTKEEVKEIIGELMEQNKMAESGMRMILTGGYSPDHYEPALPNLLIIQERLQLPSHEKFVAGVKVIMHEYQRDLPHIKSINYLMGVWLQQKIKAQNASDVLYHKAGNVSELPRANVMMVTKDDKIITPAENILYGITRMKLLELAAGKFSIEERDITTDELKNAAEVFMTSTTKRILPIVQLDDFVIGNGKAGPVTSMLNDAFIAMEDELTA
jgi:branched-chain amino acid aminotransferase